MAKTFDYNPALATAAINAYGKLEGTIAPSSGPAMIDTWAGDLVQAQMGSLVRAELLAAEAGVVPYVDLGAGQKGVLDVGAARDRIDRAPPDVRTVYLASHGAVRQSIALTRRPPPGGERLPVEVLATTYHARSGGERILPVIALVVVGVAALAAGAWYAVEKAKAQVQTDGWKAVEIAKSSRAAEVAFECIKKGIPIPKEILAALQPSAQKEEGGGGWWKVGLGLAVGVGASYGAWRAAKALRLVA